MTTYLLLRTIRLMLWGAFILSLAAATTWRQDVNIGANYLPPTLLLLALAAGFAERIYRKRHGIAPRRFWSS